MRLWRKPNKPSNVAYLISYIYQTTVSYSVGVHGPQTAMTYGDMSITYNMPLTSDYFAQLRKDVRKHVEDNGGAIEGDIVITSVFQFAPSRTDKETS